MVHLVVGDEQVPGVRARRPKVAVHDVVHEERVVRRVASERHGSEAMGTDEEEGVHL